MDSVPSNTPAPRDHIVLGINIECSPKFLLKISMSCKESRIAVFSPLTIILTMGFDHITFGLHVYSDIEQKVAENAITHTEHDICMGTEQL